MPILPLLLAAMPIEADTLRQFNIEEAVVVASPKETQQLRRQPLSVSLFSTKEMKAHNVTSLKDLSAFSPNFYMPAYGSRLTSAVYIRGIGSRINTPAVGLYVDNVPYVDKSAYDFAFNGIERVDVLRGPQGTLYGRNTMGGLVRVFTADPLTHHGTELSAGWTSKSNERRFSALTFLHPAHNMGLSLNAYYNASDGFYRNAYNGKKQDASDAAGGRVRWAWQASDVVRLDWTASYEYSDEKACPYFYTGTVAANTFTPKADGEELAQNRPSSYRRSLFNTGLGVEHRLKKCVLTSITSFQHLTDRLFMDQDFTRADIFSLEQRQFMNTVSEEVALKSRDRNARWQWSTGAFAMYQYQRTGCPVTFYTDGISMLNSQLAAVLPAQPSMELKFTGSTLPFNARMVTPSTNAAIYHQSTVNDLGLRGLSLTLGLRLDYDYRSLNLAADNGSSALPYSFGMSMGPAMRFNTDLEADASFAGKMKHTSWQVLPKASLSYALPRELGNVYFSVSKGYRSGGYNIQSYSDLSQTALRRAVMLGVKDYSIATINALPLPDAQKQGAIQGMTSVLDAQIPAEANITSLYYKPEYTWSYEFGIHHDLAGKTLQLDLSAFYMKTRDQQLARFAESGLGRVMVNAGRSRSVGVEASVRSTLLAERLNLSATYGYTHATFTAYDLGTSSSTGQRIDYTGNRVPFVPEHTFTATADFRQPLEGHFLQAVSAGADVKGAGSVMWDEANTFSQRFYATLGAHLAFEFGKGVSLDLWGRNLTASRYATFSFDSMQRRFAQYGQPRHFGADIRWKF